VFCVYVEEKKGREKGDVRREVRRDKCRCLVLVVQYPLRVYFIKNNMICIMLKASI